MRKWKVSTPSPINERADDRKEFQWWPDDMKGIH